MNIEDIIAAVQDVEIANAESQTQEMETADIAVFGPMNMLAF